MEDTCRLTHNTSEAIGAATAVAAVVSAGIDGADLEDALPIALAAAKLAEKRGTPPANGLISENIERALGMTTGRTGLADAVEIAGQVGTDVSAMTSVPMAFAILRLSGGDPWQAALLRANIGDDTDTIGAIACGMAASCTGLKALPGHAVETVTRVNTLDFEPVVTGLLTFRHAEREHSSALEHAS